MVGESSEIPEEVSSEIASGVKKEFTGSRKSWNQRFNKIANNLEARMQGTRGSFGSTKTEASLASRSAARFGENLAKDEFKVLLKLVELAAKATGGRQTGEEK